jgi:tRNA (cytidine56-2'-O)-methyltransferase
LQEKKITKRNKKNKLNQKALLKKTNYKKYFTKLVRIIREIIVIRYGHRTVRDYRVTSHCALVARALGAKEIIICGDKDESMKKSVDDVTKRWGGPFKVSFEEDWKNVFKKLKKKKIKLAHLTMYGENITGIEKKLKKEQKIAVLIGSQKVEREVYEKVDYNIAITHQPHSEIAALAIFLDRYQEGKELEKKFKNKKICIKGQKNGKKVVNLKRVGSKR